MIVTETNYAYLFITHKKRLYDVVERIKLL